MPPPGNMQSGGALAVFYNVTHQPKGGGRLLEALAMAMAVLSCHHIANPSRRALAVRSPRQSAVDDGDAPVDT